jgi:tRNA (guanine-N7-)-methyltransferase
MAVSERPIRTYGRSKSRPLKPGQVALVETFLPSVAIPAGRFDPDALGFTETWLEIGFGGGEHLAMQAQRRPDVLFLGAEPFVNGIASALRRVRQASLGNVRLWPGDARALMANLPDACLARLFLLFPDPWPKVRHHKRRLVDETFAREAARLLRPGGRLRLVTDWTSYLDQTLGILTRDPAFAWTAERAADWRNAPADHVTTRYQAKGLGDCAPVWLEFVRR